MVPLSEFLKELKDVKNTADDTMPLFVEDHIELIEETVLRIGQHQN